HCIPCCLLPTPPPRSTLLPYPTLFRSLCRDARAVHCRRTVVRRLQPDERRGGARSARASPHGTAFDALAGTSCPGSPECARPERDRKSTRLNSSHVATSYAVFWLKNKR